MRKLLIVKELTSPFYNEKFGVLARDIITGEFFYYTHFNEEGNYQGNKYFRLFNPQNKKELPNIIARYNESFGKRNEMLCDYLKFLKPMVIDLITKHIKYNQSHNCLTDLLIFNKNNLSVNMSITLPNEGAKGQYLLFENEILLTPRIAENNHPTLEEKKELKELLSHELGHCKVSKIELNGNQELISKMGFVQYKDKIETFLAKDKNIMIHIIENYHDNLRENILEEIYNELEISEILPDYDYGYPSYGVYIDKLTNGKLRLSRYIGSIEDYYEIFENTYGTRVKAEELLDYMAESVNNETYQEKSFSLLKKYINSKN